MTLRKNEFSPTNVETFNLISVSLVAETLVLAVFDMDIKLELIYLNDVLQEWILAYKCWDF